MQLLLNLGTTLLSRFLGSVLNLVIIWALSNLYGQSALGSYFVAVSSSFAFAAFLNFGFSRFQLSIHDNQKLQLCILNFYLISIF